MAIKYARLAALLLASKLLSAHIALFHVLEICCNVYKINIAMMYKTVKMRDIISCSSTEIV